jgi:hypothetical protein
MSRPALLRALDFPGCATIILAEKGCFRYNSGF